MKRLVFKSLRQTQLKVSLFFPSQHVRRSREGGAAGWGRSHILHSYDAALVMVDRSESDPSETIYSFIYSSFLFMKEEEDLASGNKTRKKKHWRR